MNVKKNKGQIWYQIRVKQICHLKEKKGQWLKQNQMIILRYLLCPDDKFLMTYVLLKKQIAASYCSHAEPVSDKCWRTDGACPLTG